MTELSEQVATPAQPSADWRRLDRRMLLVHPVNEVVRFFPFLIGVYLLGSNNSGGGPWGYLGVAVPVVIGVVRFFSTRYRITSGQIELRRGLLGRGIRTAPLDRVRTVELTASPIHRLLGLERVEIGTGSGSGENSGLELDSLGRADAARLRAELLDRASSLAPVAGSPPQAAEAQVLLRFDPSWARFAPLTTSGLLIALAAGGAVVGPAFGSNLDIELSDAAVVERFLDLAVPVLIAFVAVGVLVLASVLGVLGYLLGNWRFTLSRNPAARTLEVRRGALTTRATSVDLDRLRGVEIHQPLGLRLAGGSHLSAVVTGLGRTSATKPPLAPAAPSTVVAQVVAQVLGQPDLAATRLISHGPAALRRRLIRSTGPALMVPLTMVTAAALLEVSWWWAVVTLAVPVAAVYLARDRYARLGHGLDPSFVVIRQGSLRGRTDLLERTGIIGWNISQSFFQRRAGLVTLTATTAAGEQGYAIPDIPEADAIRFAVEAVPDLAAQFATR